MLVITMIYLFVGCGPALLDECTSAPLGACPSVQTCCNSTECYFLVNGEEFLCDDDKACDAAIAEVETTCDVAEEPT
jgi:hypothetical protein